MNGSTDAKELAKKKVRIWIPNTTKEFLDKRNLDYEIGDIGPMYGFQWKHYGAEYKGKDYDYTDKGINQIDKCLEILRNDPNNRRILMTTYNPSQVEQGVLCPCHGLITQFYVENNYLSCHMYQRSSDTFLGLPFNISSYSLLTYIFAKELNMKPGKLYISLGDTHIYNTHINQVKKQLKRIPFQFPKLIINKQQNIYSYKYQDFNLQNYECYNTLKAKMVA